MIQGAEQQLLSTLGEQTAATMETRRAAAEIRRLRQRVAQRSSGLAALQQELARTLVESAQVEVRRPKPLAREVR